MIQLINRVVMILDFVAGSRRPVRLPEIADATGLGRAVCSNIISSLSANGLLEKQGSRRNYEYTIGRKIYQYSRMKSYKDELVQISAELMDEFSEKEEASCILCVLEDTERVIIHESKPGTRLQVLHKERISAYGSDMGKLLLAHLGESEIEKFVHDFGLPHTELWHGVEDLESLKQELKKIRDNGSRPIINSDHVVVIFSPVSSKGKIIAGLGAYLPFNYYSAEKIAQIQLSFETMVSEIIDRCSEKQLDLLPPLLSYR